MTSSEPAVSPSYFHVAMTVPALEPALEELTKLLGYSWRQIFEATLPVREPGGGDRDIPLRFAYSQEEPFLEVIEAVPATPWALHEGSSLHHIGFWSEAVPTASASLANAGCPMEICGRGADGDGDGPAGFAYHHALGIRIEVIDRATEAIIRAAG